MRNLKYVNLECPLFWFTGKKQSQKDECRILLAIDPPSPEVISDKDEIEEVTLQSLDLFSRLFSIKHIGLECEERLMIAHLSLKSVIQLNNFLGKSEERVQVLDFTLLCCSITCCSLITFCNLIYLSSVFFAGRMKNGSFQDVPQLLLLLQLQLQDCQTFLQKLF